MKCPEAVEWMHRYLDRDLNEEESFLLFEHIRSCRDCADMFELLNKLSARLEELPKVVPNFSLVDAILPQLDAIDRARREEGTAAEAEVPPMTAVKTNEMMPDIRSTRQSEREKSLRRSRAYRLGSLGVAAALILGVFIYQYEPRTISDAEMSMDSVLQESQSADSSSSGSANDAAAGSAKLFEDASGSEAEMDSGDGQSGGAEPSAGSPAAEDSKNAGNRSEGDGNNGETGSSPETVSPPQEDNNSAKPGNAAGKSGSADGGESQGASQENPDQRASDSGAPAQDQIPSEMLDIQGNTEDSGTAGEADQQVQEQKVADSGELQGITTNHLAIPKNPNVWASPDGMFEAELKDGHLYIYKKEFQDRKLVFDQAIDGNWVKGAWSEEGNTFTYETEIDGTAAVHTVEAEEAAAAGSAGTQP